MLFTCKYLTSRNQTQTRCAQLGSLRLSIVGERERATKEPREQLKRSPWGQMK